MLRTAQPEFWLRNIGTVVTEMFFALTTPDPDPADSDLDSVQYLRNFCLLKTAKNVRGLNKIHGNTWVLYFPRIENMKVGSVPSPFMTAFTNLRMYGIIFTRRKKYFFKVSYYATYLLAQQITNNRRMLFLKTYRDISWYLPKSPCLLSCPGVPRNNLKNLAGC